MNRYNLYCTPEQIKKALELGAPIIKATYQDKEPHIGVLVKLIGGERIYDYIRPTAEQMLGWLRSKGFRITIDELPHTIVTYKVALGYRYVFGQRCDPKEATLAAIDAALEYLIKYNQ